MKKLTFDVNNLLQHTPDAEDQCIDRLIGSLEKRKGIRRISLKRKKEAMLQLNVLFDDETITEDQIRNIAKQTGERLSNTFGHLWIKMQEIRDTDHTRTVTTLLKNFKGVMNVLIIPTGWIFLEFNTYITQESVLRELIEKMDLVV